MRNVYIVSAARTPIGSFSGCLSTAPAVKLGAVAINGVLNKLNLSIDKVQGIYMGNAPQEKDNELFIEQLTLETKEAKLNQLPIDNGFKSGGGAVIAGIKAISSEEKDIIVAGGMGSSSLDKESQQVEKQSIGELFDIYSIENNISREKQDKYAIQSYQRSTRAWVEGRFLDEIVPIDILQDDGKYVFINEDEEYKNIQIDEFPQLKPVFSEKGTITLANSAKLGDGASAVVLMSEDKIKELGIKPLAKVKSFAEIIIDEKEIVISISNVLKKALNNGGLELFDLDYFEFNETFSVEVLANAKALGIDLDIVNVNGGAISLGNPQGALGSRQLVTLINILKQNAGKYGCVVIYEDKKAYAVIIENI